MDFGNISTNIIKKGLVFNMDAANRASTIPVSMVETSFNTLNLPQSGSFSDNGIFDSSTITPSFAFGGTDDYIGTNFIIPALNSYTLSAWWKSTTTSQDRIILADFNSGAQNSSARAILGFNGTRIYLSMGNGSTQNNNYGSGYNASSYFDGNWHLYVVTIEGVTQKAYMDTNLVETWTSTVSSGTIGERGYTIGRYGDYTSANYFNGNIGPIHIYNRALSASEVLFNYNSLKSRFGL
jgi:hypothetical protein